MKCFAQCLTICTMHKKLFTGVVSGSGAWSLQETLILYFSILFDFFQIKNIITFTIKNSQFKFEESDQKLILKDYP